MSRDYEIGLRHERLRAMASRPPRPVRHRSRHDHSQHRRSLRQRAGLGLVQLGMVVAGKVTVATALDAGVSRPPAYGS